MLNRTTGLLVILLSFGTYWLGGDYMRMRRENAALVTRVDEQSKRIAEQAVVLDWLREPILQAKGKTYSRAQLIDLVLKVALDGSPKDK